MKNRFLENPISSYLGLLFIAFGFVLFFVPTQFELPLYAPFLVWFLGLGLILAKDKMIDILTFGLSSLIEFLAGKFKK